MGCTSSNNSPLEKCMRKKSIVFHNEDYNYGTDPADELLTTLQVIPEKYRVSSVNNLLQYKQLTTRARMILLAERDYLDSKYSDFIAET